MKTRLSISLSVPLLLVVLACLHASTFAASSSTKRVESDKVQDTKWFKQAEAKFLSGLKAIKKKSEALVAQFEKLDYEIRSIEKEWLGVQMPLSVQKQYDKLEGRRSEIMAQHSALIGQSSGLWIEVGDQCLQHGEADLAEECYQHVITESKKGSDASMKAAGRLLPICSNRARALDARKEYGLAEAEWQRIVDMIGSGHPKAAEANSRLAYYVEQKRKLREKIASIKEPSLAGLRIGEPIAKAEEIYGDVYGHGQELFGEDPADVMYEPQMVYYSKADDLWLAIWVSEFDESSTKTITGVLLTSASDFNVYKHFRKDCGVSFNGTATSQGIKVGDRLAKAISIYGDHETPDEGSLYYQTGDSDGSAIPHTDYLRFDYDAKTKLITACSIWFEPVR